MSVNEDSAARVQTYAAAMEHTFASYVRSVLDLSESAAFKLDLIQRRVDRDRKDLRAYEHSQPWEDEA